jgi:hypothetical protein
MIVQQRSRRETWGRITNVSYRRGQVTYYYIQWNDARVGLHSAHFLESTMKRMSWKRQRWLNG